MTVFLVLGGVFLFCGSATAEEELKLSESEDSNKVNGTDTSLQTEIIKDNPEIDEGVNPTYLSGDPEDGRIMPNDNDYRVIPDKYNTGCKGELAKIQGTFNDISGIEARLNDNKLVFNFFYWNKGALGTYVIENYDFSDYKVAIYDETLVSDKKIKLIFKNCRFGFFNNGRPESEVFKYEFYNCSFTSFQGSNAYFSRCSFGDSYNDCLVPFSNIRVEDCYFFNLASNDPQGNGIHSDGTQMYGYKDSMVQNILFSNCRFEMPAVKTTQSTAYVNACIMLSIEFNDGKGITIENCILNGGGYSIYAGKKYGELNLEDVTFKNVKIGDAKLYGNIYPKYDKDVVFDCVENQDSLYVSSVWNDDYETHIIVTNDTAKERVLRVITGNGSKDYIISPCLGGDMLKNGNEDKPFEEFPFDIEIKFEKSNDYVLCLDVTDGYDKQIRYVSFDGKTTYYNLKEESVDNIVGYSADKDGKYFTPDNDVIILQEGKCGEKANYSIDDTGRLLISGTGAMEDYNSKKPAPWIEYSDYITSIEIDEGITKIGAQAFRKLTKVNSVSVSESVNTIGSNAFIDCKNLKNLTFYSGTKLIGAYAFWGTGLKECRYYGTEEEWNAINIGENNNPLQSCEKIYISG